MEFGASGDLIQLINGQELDPIYPIVEKVSNISNIFDGFFGQVPEGYDQYKYTKQLIGITQEFISNYWERAQNTGLGLAQIDDLFMLLTLLRFIILAIRYNIITSFIITAISIVAGYVWYSNFLAALFTYENAFYKYSLTYRLGMDVSQLKQILRTKVQKEGYQIRLSNPVGIIAYAIVNGSIHQDHRIDFISMYVTKVPINLSIDINFFGKFCITLTKRSIESGYYYMHRKLIPVILRLTIKGLDQITTYGLYTYMTRVNKRYCPYLVRWHWTMVILSGFFQGFLVYVAGRMTMYVEYFILPIIKEGQRLHIIIPHREFELQVFAILNFTLVLSQIGFQIFSMYHAVCGQYYYAPFLTDNTEMHVGLRDTNSIYSGGYTAWQNTSEKRRTFLNTPKIWYGWFGRGSSTPNLISYVIRKFIFKPIYRFIRKLLRFGRRKR